MNESSNTPVYDSTLAAPEPFYKVWLKAITKPNEQTFAEIANSPGASPNKAYLWLVIAYIFTFFVSMLVVFFSSSSQYGNFGEALGGSVIALICGAPIGAVVGLLFYALEVAIIQWVAKLFKGTGSYNQLIYAFAAFTAPITLVSGALSAFSLIPFIGLCFSIISIGIGFYSIFLMITAVKGVNKFGWGEAAGSVLLPGLVLIFVCGCLTIGILMLLGPVIGDVFSTINSSLGY
jgi:hypothetical protein